MRPASDHAQYRRGCDPTPLDPVARDLLEVATAVLA